MGTFEEPKGGPLDIGEEYLEITILGWEEYWVTGENIHPCWWVSGCANLIYNDLAESFALNQGLSNRNNILTNIY